MAKTLGSQAYRIASSTDPATIIAALPGDRGMATLLDGLARAGVPHDELVAVESAVRGIRRIFERTQASKREISAIAAGGLDSEAQRRHQAKIQKAHFESSVALRGEVANAMVSAWFVTPARKDPRRATLVSTDMLDGFRTIRPLGPRLVHRGIAFDGKANARDWTGPDSAHNAIPSLVPAASTTPLGPDVIESHHSDRGLLILADPDAHPTGTLTLTFAEVIEAIGPIHAGGGDRTAELSTQVAMPMRHLYLDVFLDERLPPVAPETALYYSSTRSIEYGIYAELRRFTGEIDGRFVRNPKLPATAKVDPAKHAAMLEHGAAMIDRPLEAFRCFRMHVAYPPSFTRAVVRWLLPDPPDA